MKPIWAASCASSSASPWPSGYGRVDRSRYVKGKVLGGPVVLAWDAVLAGGREETWGNVVIHELAHKLDMASGRVDGAPPLPTRRERARWAAVCADAFAVHGARVEAGWPTVIDAYGASNAAEFFAVATETLFEKPHQMARHHGRLFETLQSYYRVDPREWLAE